MDLAQRTALRKCRVKLVNDLMVEEMFDSVESRALFTPIMLECIKAKESRPEKVRTMLDYLQRRGPDAFDIFIQCLRETAHQHVASYLLQEYLTQKNSSQNNRNNNPVPVSMVNNIYLTQETQGQGQSSGSQEVSQGSNEMDMREDSAMEDSEGDAIMEVTVSPGIQDSQSNIPGSTAQGTCSSIQAGFGASLISQASNMGYTGNLTEEYRMESDPRGLLLIINNKDFQGGLNSREGTDVDCDKLKTLFMTLGFGVDVRNNLTALEIKLNLRILSQHELLKTVDCLAVALLTHGTEDTLYGTDGKYINVSDVFESFTAINCPALHHKPKFFIINACRGDTEDKGSFIDMVHESKTFTDVKSMPPETNMLAASTSAENKRNRIPNMKDFLVAYSTIPGHVSWRHLNEGSFFIQDFVKVFQEYCDTTDVMKMLVKVNDHVSRNIDHQGVQIPAPQVMLTKTWYLNPPPRNPV